MSDRRLNEKEEEKQEKEVEKTEEKSPEEKNWDEKWRRDPVNTAAWAAIFIWAGFVFLLDNLGLLARFLSGIGGESLVEALQPWGVVLVGAGGIVILSAAARLLIPEHRRPVFGTFILGIFLISIGLGELFSWNIILPLLLIALGISILVRGFINRR
ncbi:MAG: hypothetical protein JW908_09680 [Anaerolineales bacterium]|nr:hypothetical protein [Anaerolineales bacterium]